MVYRNATAVSIPVEFPSGFPDGNITWTLYNEAGGVVASGTLAPLPGAVSTQLIIPAISNTLTGANLSGYRDLVLSYIVGGVIFNEDVRYSIEARVPWGASASGVRNKLGVQEREVPNEDISLVRAYYNFLTTMGDPDLTSFAPTSRQQLALSDAVEAVAGLSLIPSLQLRAAIKESSGTDTYQRYPADWALLASELEAIIQAGVLIVIPTFDLFATAGAIFILAPPTVDALTGA